LVIVSVLKKSRLRHWLYRL